MKIAIITPQLSQGGAEKMVYHLALGLKNFGDEVTVYSSGGYYGEKLIKAGIKSPKFPLASFKAWFKPEFWKSFADALRKGDYDIFHVQTIPLAFLIRLMTRIYNLNSRTILTLHGSPEWKIKLFYPILRKLKLKKLAVSIRLAEQVDGKYIPNAVDIPTQMQNIKPKYFLQRQTLIQINQSITLNVLIVARLVPEKGIDLWLKAVKQLKAEGITIETWLAGEGPERESLQQYGMENGLRIHFLGWIEDPWKLSSKIDLLILPSRREGEPLALLEAMASSVPILATEVGGVPELLKDGRGICVEPSPEGLVRGIREFLQLSHSDYIQMLKKSYGFIRSRSWKTCVAAYREQYRAILAEEEKIWDKD